METLPQSDKQANNATRSVRIRDDIWEVARVKAFNGRTTIVDVIDSVLRNHFVLGASEQSLANDTNEQVLQA